MKYSFSIMAISSTLSNISSIIPISPSGIGVSEFVFSEVTQKIAYIDNSQSISTIYFSYRVLLLLSHFINYYFSRYLNIKKFN